MDTKSIETGLFTDTLEQGPEMTRFPHTNARIIAIMIAIVVGSVFFSSGQFNPAHADDGNGDRTSSVDTFRQQWNDLRERMDENLSDAAEYLESQIAKDPDSEDLNTLRHAVATRFIEQQQYNEAAEQFRKLLEFQCKHREKPTNQFGILMTVQSIQDMTRHSGDDETLENAVDRGIEALQSAELQDQQTPLLPLSQLAVLKAHFLVRDDHQDDADAIVQSVLQKLVSATESKDSDEETMLALLRMLRSLTTTDRENDSWREEFITQLDQSVTSAMDAYPDSAAIQNEYAETQYLMITQWRQDDPDATTERIKQVTATLNSLAVRNATVRAMLRRLDLHRERIASVKPVDSLIGKPAPKWDVDAWVDTSGTTQESLKGKVVLLDFWAMWCGPCIATFPHLRQWREEFGEQGFEIVGVTQYYNFDWDEEKSQATRSKDDVPPPTERFAIARFLEHHQLQHPVMVTPNESEMPSEYGVRGIPHVVLIDRDGVVQFVKTGAGEATAKEIHAKIKELVEAGKKSE
ncbi:Redoxin domain protein [Rhodopirellula maiorica SM1]|uniref:Redoxin domain protein n=1 Tax=Rhodopirellula maiorica SM1 TaxID=1265738 RepID=M5RUE3_9BACT|nr:TlpA disulfide reductase family protein [Rhodopirellula maiorica]EMI22963.1 Redoxin domain protein [Rhodopirellula maiorica SM1]